MYQRAMQYSRYRYFTITSLKLRSVFFKELFNCDEIVVKETKYSYEGRLYSHEFSLLKVILLIGLSKYESIPALLG